MPTRYRFPITMATQHPDNASTPWWKEDGFVTTHDEIEEVALMHKDLGIDEYMWDWEGKYVDEAVGEKLFSRLDRFYFKHPLGTDTQLTYRIPAFDGEKMHRMARAMMNILALADLGRDLGFKKLPVHEMFLPLTTKAEQPMKVRSAFREITGYHRSVFHGSSKLDAEILELFEVTPLVEDVDSLLHIDRILRPYWRSIQKERDVRDQRIFLARSDPAMNAGLVPAVLAAKQAISHAYAVGEELGIAVHPVIGTGALPFRGSVNPQYTDTFLHQYAGVRTYSIQSAFRYDYPIEEVKKALKTIKKRVPLEHVVRIPERDARSIVTLCSIFEELWRPTIEAAANLINDVAACMPRRRERLQHIGLFGYSRGVGKVRLPRAIGFTCGLYSIGVPPELITTGRGLKAAHDAGFLDVIERYYPALRDDLRHAGKYLNRENLAFLSKKSVHWKGVQDDVSLIEEMLNISLEPEKPRHLIHRNLTSSIYQKLTSKDYPKDAIQRDIIDAAVIRRSLG